ncbi:hypothetical protein B0H15DRAFT_860893 [Mycena belliarum]|uniref:F-box domain-containing protein n=1 Tax=Mycena belliarum TaxID=1033014 RepID=A0AAD6TSD9_9AGAR|nr:hypothetical protein B0H15DRAFT_860893 [Mycena belliae]
MAGSSSAWCCSSCGYINESEFSPYLVAPSPLLLSNEPPTNSQISEIVAALASQTEVLASQDAGIVSLTAALDKLAKERAATAEALRIHTITLSALRRMPTEILRHIFSMAVPHHTHLAPPPVPWHLAQISQRWRAVAVGFPALWTAFGVDVGAGAKQHAPAFEEQLRRAGDAPLQVTICGDSSTAPEPLRVLLRVCERWEILGVPRTEKMPDGARGLPVYLRGIQGRTPLLRRLCIGGPSEPVKVLELADVWSDLDVCALDSGLPWERLTRYDGTLDRTTLVHVLRGAPHLVECRLDCFGTQTATAGNFVVLPALKRLCVSNAHELTRITAPALEELALKGFGIQKHSADWILGFLQRSGCALRALALLECTHVWTLLPVLRAAPSLRELAVVSTPYEYDFTLLLELLTPGASSPLLPNLTAMSLGNMHGALPQARAVQMVSARREGRAGYRHVEFLGFVSVAGLEWRARERETLERMMGAGLRAVWVRGAVEYRRMLATDPYSVPRCAAYSVVAFD